MIKDGKKLRYGYTTGSCSAAAAKASVIMLLTEQEIYNVELMTPKGILLNLHLFDVRRGTLSVSCAVQKDAGDDSDVTDGILVYARAEKVEFCGDEKLCGKERIQICAGEGIGKVTKPGLDQPVGAYAINSGPQVQIKRAVLDVLDRYGYSGHIRITLSVPDGKRLAEKTFNPKLGIIGGISIIGTSGIVEPMSEDALLASVALEIHVKAESGYRKLILTPGNYGQDFIKEKLNLPLDCAVKCSNFIGDALVSAWKEGFQEILLIGHMGKLIKLGAGAWNTHSRYGDGRIEEIVRCIKEAGFPGHAAAVSGCVTTEDAADVMQEQGILEPVMVTALAHIKQTLDKWKTEQGIMEQDGHVEVIMFSRKHEIMESTDGAERILKKIRQEMQMKEKNEKKIYIYAYTDHGRQLLDDVKKKWKQKKIQLIAGDRKDAGRAFQAADTYALVFIGAAGIAVRSIAPYVKSKLTDPAVLVMDECAVHVIPVLSGHYGGANQLALEFAQLTGAEPVITTATDLHGCFAVDIFAKKNKLYIREPELIRKISSAVLQGQMVGISSELTVIGKLPKELQWGKVKGRMEESETDVMETNVIESGKMETEETGETIKTGFYIGHKKINPYLITMHLVPKDIVVGIGCRRGKKLEELRVFLAEVLCRSHLDEKCIAAVASIDRKAEESGILKLAEELQVPFLVYSAETLCQVSGSYTASEFVERQMGVDNVCERSAAAAAGAGAVWICRKTARDGMTIAVIRKNMYISF